MEPSQEGKQLQAVDGPIKVCKVNGRVKELMKTSSFDNLIDIHDHERQPLQHSNSFQSAQFRRSSAIDLDSSQGKSLEGLRRLPCGGLAERLKACDC